MSSKVSFVADTGDRHVGSRIDDHPEAAIARALSHVGRVSVGDGAVEARTAGRGAKAAVLGCSGLIQQLRLLALELLV